MARRQQHNTILSDPFKKNLKVGFKKKANFSMSELVIYTAVWKLVNEIAGRKNSRLGKPEKAQEREDEVRFSDLNSE